MTEPEEALEHLRSKLRTVEAECLCGAIPSVKYEPGVLLIVCWRCRKRGEEQNRHIPHGVCVPDFEPEAVYARWLEFLGRD